MNNSNAILFVKTVAVLSIQTNANSLLQYKHTGVCMPSCRLQVQTENVGRVCHFIGSVVAYPEFELCSELTVSI